jgi:hypothetical protein
LPSYWEILVIALLMSLVLPMRKYFLRNLVAIEPKK